MRINRRTLYNPPAAALVLAVAILAWASPAPAFPRGGHGGAAMALEHATELGLSPEQVQRVEALRTKQRETMSGDREDLKARHEALKGLLSAESIDRAAAEQEADALAEAMAAHQRSRLQAKIDLAEILTPDQRQALREMKKEKRGRWHKR